MNMNIDVMAAIQEEKSRETGETAPMPLDPEGQAVAEEKRKAFDLPTNAVKVDPLR